MGRSDGEKSVRRGRASRSRYFQDSNEGRTSPGRSSSVRLALFKILCNVHEKSTKYRRRGEKQHGKRQYDVSDDANGNEVRAKLKCHVTSLENVCHILSNFSVMCLANHNLIFVTISSERESLSLSLSYFHCIPLSAFLSFDPWNPGHPRITRYFNGAGKKGLSCTARFVMHIEHGSVAAFI